MAGGSSTSIEAGEARFPDDRRTPSVVVRPFAAGVPPRGRLTIHASLVSCRFASRGRLRLLPTKTQMALSSLHYSWQMNRIGGPSSGAGLTGIFRVDTDAVLQHAASTSSLIADAPIVTSPLLAPSRSLAPAHSQIKAATPTPDKHLPSSKLSQLTPPSVTEGRHVRLLGCSGHGDGSESVGVGSSVTGDALRSDDVPMHTPIGNESSRVGTGTPLSMSGLSRLLQGIIENPPSDTLPRRYPEAPTNPRLTHYSIYLHKLLVWGHGLPCWKPMVIIPGDVGTFTESGGFCKLFNLWEEDDTMNYHRGVNHPLPLPTQTTEIFNGDGIILSHGIQCTTERLHDGRIEYRFDCHNPSGNNPSGAILVMNCPAQSVELDDPRALEQYLESNAKTVFRRASKKVRVGEKLPLFIITGAVRTDAWAIAAYQQGDLDGQSPTGKTLRLELFPGNEGQTRTPSYRWVESGCAETSCGTSDEGIKDQAVFLRGFKLQFSPQFVKRAQEGDAEEQTDSVPPADGQGCDAAEDNLQAEDNVASPRPHRPEVDADDIGQSQTALAMAEDSQDQNPTGVSVPSEDIDTLSLPAATVTQDQTESEREEEGERTRYCTSWPEDPRTRGSPSRAFEVDRGAAYADSTPRKILGTVDDVDALEEYAANHAETFFQRVGHILRIGTELSLTIVTGTVETDGWEKAALTQREGTSVIHLNEQRSLCPRQLGRGESHRYNWLVGVAGKGRARASGSSQEDQTVPSRFPDSTGQRPVELTAESQGSEVAEVSGNAGRFRVGNAMKGGASPLSSVTGG
ncbi:hypothetical protein NMY22_g15079 [Coprinellus aureogranulatus]|nr:hypothetical protein NMY22_g15079 [Coprinellus aureogranulatus]